MAFTRSTNDDSLRWLSGRAQARRCSNCFLHVTHYPTKNPAADRRSRAYILRVFPLLSSGVNTTTLQVTQNRPLSPIWPRDTDPCAAYNFNVAWSCSQSRWAQLIRAFRSSVCACRYWDHRGNLDIFDTKPRSYESHIRRITQRVENTWHSYCHFSKGTFSYLSDSTSSQEFSRSYLNSRI